MRGLTVFMLLQRIALSAALPSSGLMPEGSISYISKRAPIEPIAVGSPDQIAGGQIANDAPPVKSFLEGLKPPFPTNSWWAPFAAPPGNGTAAGPFPFQSALDGSGLQFGISDSRSFDGTSIKQPTQVYWVASFTEHPGDFASHRATSFDTQAITVQYFEGDKTMDAYLVPGSPYMTFEFKGATPKFSAMNGISSFNGKDVAVGNTVEETGTEFTVVSDDGSSYIIYSLSTITLTANSESSTEGTITATSAFDGVIRLAKLFDDAHKDTLDKYHKTFPTAVMTDYEISDSTGSLIFEWTTTGAEDELLMLTWPHHRLTMQNAAHLEPSALAYLTTKGWMYGATGNRWSMQYELSEISWDAPRPLDTSCSDSVLRGLEYEIGQLDASSAPVPGDFYYWGGALAAQSRLALIADSLSRTDLLEPVIEYLKASFDHWFQSSSETLPAYETGWGGVISKAGANNVYVDFGNGFYNDHHFHYGYFLNVAAVIAKFDQAWLDQHRDYINYFARDIVNPSSDDPYFPVARCRDWFAGHSWASGIANGAGSRDQESVGEAINGYYGALLWASVALPDEHIRYAKLLIATEQHAAQVYWHLYPSQDQNDGDNPYPEPEARDLITMGNVMDYQAGAWLFWGEQKVQIAAIQILPVTPVNEVLYDQEWVENVWSYTMNELVDPAYGDEWRCVIVAAYANANPQVAASWSANLTNWGSGNTYTNELYFIGTRPNPTSAPICGNLPENPYGVYRLAEQSSGKFISATSANPDLVASASADDAVTFRSSYFPNAGTIQLESTDKFVTADSSGNFTLSASRDTASAWERFVVRKKIGASDDVYTIKASSNGKFVTVGSDGSLKNNASTEGEASGFQFVATKSA